MIDVLLVLVILSYAVSGYRQGLIVGATCLAGFVGGAVLAMTLAPPLADRIQPGLPRTLSVLAAVLVLAWVGQLLGAVLGGKVRDRLDWRPVRLVDQLLGTVAGVLAVTLVVWFIGGALRGSPSPALAKAIADSRVLSAVDQAAPEQLSSLADSFRESVAGSSFPRVFAGVGPEQILPVDPPDPNAMSQQVLAKVRLSIVKITGNAVSCSRGQEGSGAVVSRERVVTNAHVVAGVEEPFVQVSGVGRKYRASVVLFDSLRDIAVLAVPGLTAQALPLGGELDHSDSAVVAGFPHNGPFKAGPARIRAKIRASGEDIYGRNGAVREVYSLLATVEPGNSGGPLLSPRGKIVGIVFAKSLDDANTGYALTLGESRGSIRAGTAATRQVPTGGCAVG
jgi:S1-C subfamily serine protease